MNEQEREGLKDGVCHKSGEDGLMATAQVTMFPLCYLVFCVKIKLNGHLKLLLAYRKAITGIFFSFWLGNRSDNTREINQFFSQ